jgi:hypothetical protein
MDSIWFTQGIFDPLVDFVAPTIGTHISESSPFILTMHRYPTQNMLSNKWKLAAFQEWIIRLIAKMKHHAISCDSNIRRTIWQVNDLVISVFSEWVGRLETCCDVDGEYVE